MADPATIAAVAAVAGAGASVVGGISTSQSQSRAAAFEAQQYEEQQENARVAAIQDEAQRRRDLQRVLAQQDALRAGAGNVLTTGSANRLRKDTTDQAERDIRTSRLNFLNQQSQFGLAASEARGRNTSGAILSGVGSAVGTLSGVDWGVFKTKSGG